MGTTSTRRLNSLLAFALLTLLGADLFGQTCATTVGGPSCNRSTFIFGNILPNNGCGTFNTVAPYSPGEYFTLPVLEGACYTVSTCGSPVDTRISAFQGTSATTNPFAFNDNNGPDCAAAQASIVMVPNFTDVTAVDVRQGNCLTGGTNSISVKVRQNNNLTFTSSGADMCEGEVRNLTATPATVTGVIPTGAGNAGAFSGTGVNGTVFTAPVPSGASQIYTITYTFGYCNVTQDITVFKNPTFANAGIDQVVCDPTATLAGNVANIGTGTWSIISGPGTVANANSPQSGLTGLIQDSTTVLVWTISNGPCAASSDTVMITREDTPTPPNAGADTSICGDSIVLIANTLSVGSGSWSLIGGSGTIAVPSNDTTLVTGLGIGPNTFRWTVVNGNCPPVSDDVVITRDDFPTQAFAGADQSICDTATVMAGNAPAVGTGTWAVITGTGTPTSPNNPNSPITGISVGTNMVTWTITNGACPSTTDTMEVMRNAPPAAPSVTGTTTVCEGSTTQLTAASNSASPSYLWWDSIVAGNTVAATTIFTTGSLVDTTTYWVTVTDGSTGCTSDRSPVTINVLPAPDVDLGADTTICGNDSICLDAGAGWSSYIWSPNFNAQVNCVNQAGTYTVVVTDANNCQGGDAINIAVVPAPTVNAGPDVEFCAGSSITIGEANPGTGVTYSWNPSGSTPTITVTTGGQYILTALDSNNCTVDDTVEVTELDVPVASFMVDTSGCPIIDFTDNSTDASDYTWNFGNGTSSNVENPSQDYTNSGGGLYQVTLTVSNICGTDSVTLPVNIGCLVGLEPLLSNLDISLYPNPNTGRFRVAFSDLQQAAELRVFDLTGKELYQSEIESPYGAHEEIIDLGEVSQGVYFFRLKVGSYQLTKRFVVE